MGSMGRGKAIGKDRYPCRPRKTHAVSLVGQVLLALSCLALLSPLFAPGAAAQTDLVFTDLWDSPHRLGAICDGRATILFVCDAELSVCREGAVYFDMKAEEIEAQDLGAALVLTGQPAEARAFALRTGIDHAIFVDSDRRVFETLLDQEVLPALVLVDGEGLHLKTLYGGGESLEGNIDILLDEARGKGPRWWLILIPIAVAALLPFLLS